MNMYNNNPFYMQNLQDMRDRIDNQMRQIQQQQNQFQQQQPAPITQNFQLAPTQANSEIEGKYAENIDEVKNTFVIKTGVFVNKDFTTMWVKDVSGNIKTYKTEEVVELDAKDKKIIELQKQIEKLKGGVANGVQSDIADANGTTTKQKSKRVSNDPTSNE